MDVAERGDTMNDNIFSLEDIANIVKPIAKKYGVKELYLFGSYARGEADGDSDFYNTIMKERLLVA